MNKNHNEAISGTNAFQAFAKEFGPDDVYTRIFLEILLEELLLEHSNTRRESNEISKNKRTIHDK